MLFNHFTNILRCAIAPKNKPIISKTNSDIFEIQP
jgi:hypothetical protein